MSQTVRGKHRILTARLLLRPWDPADAQRLTEAVEASLPELQRWMPWARAWRSDPPVIEGRLGSFASGFEEGRDWMYGIFDPVVGSVLGGTGLHPRIGPEALEIGYWIRTDATGRGYATEAAAALTRVAFELHAVERVEIRCDEGNLASARVPERLGYRRITAIDSPLTTLDGAPLRRQIWALRRAEYPDSPSAGMGIAVRGEQDEHPGAPEAHGA